MWKQQAVETALKNKKIDALGQAFGTIDELASQLPNLNGSNLPKKKGALKTKQLMSMRAQELAKFDQIVNFKPFLSNPFGAIQTHISNSQKAQM